MSGHLINNALSLWQIFDHQRVLSISRFDLRILLGVKLDGPMVEYVTRIEHNFIRQVTPIQTVEMVLASSQKNYYKI